MARGSSAKEKAKAKPKPSLGLGGRQMLQAFRHEEAGRQPAPQKSKLKKLLLQQYLWGRTLQSIACLGNNCDSHSSKHWGVDILDLTTLGICFTCPPSFGISHLPCRLGDLHPGPNSARDLERKLPEKLLHKCLTRVKLPMLLPSSDKPLEEGTYGLTTMGWLCATPKVVHIWHSILLPHKLFSVLYEEDVGLFTKFFCGSGEKCRTYLCRHVLKVLQWTLQSLRLQSFWASMSATHWVTERGITEQEGYERHCIPLKVFGDGVAVIGVGKSWGRSVNVVSVQPFLNRDPTIISHAIIGCWWKKRQCATTLDVLWDIVSWSFAQMEKGVWPRVDWRGREFQVGTLDYTKASEEPTRLAGPFWAS
eukprot:6490439-Amphidinium_carterae.1